MSLPPSSRAPPLRSRKKGQTSRESGNPETNWGVGERRQAITLSQSPVPAMLWYQGVRWGGHRPELDPCCCRPVLPSLPSAAPGPGEGRQMTHDRLTRTHTCTLTPLPSLGTPQANSANKEGVPRAWLTLMSCPSSAPICGLLQAQLVTLGEERDSEKQSQGPFCHLPRWDRNSKRGAPFFPRFPLAGPAQGHPFPSPQFKC